MIALPLPKRAQAYASAGPRVCRFIEQNCVHGEGDYFGRPFLLRQWQRSIINAIFELKYDEARRQWRRRRRRVLLGLPSGSGKTELLAGIGLYMLLGREHVSPLIPVAAASKEQANLLFGAARIMCEESKTLRAVTETGVDSITIKGEPGRLYRVAAADGTNEGQLPSTFLADELHEWSETKNTFNVISKGTAKRVDSLQLFISTAGYDLDTICGRLYEHGKRVNAGELEDDGFLMIWFEAPPDADPSDPSTWRLAHPAAGDFMSEEALAEKFVELPRAVFERYFLNRWTAAASSWLPAGAWAACRLPDVPTAAAWPAGLEDQPLREEIRRRMAALGFDPSLPVHIGWDSSTKYDSTAIVAVQRRLTLGENEELVERMLVLSRVWERPNGRNGKPIEEWIIPIEEVTAYLWALAAECNVATVQFDPAFITWEAGKLAEGGLPMREFPQQGVRMGAASQSTYELIVSGTVGHDGDPVLARHIAAAVAKQSRQGSASWRLVKGDAKRKMDASIALAMAIWSVTHPADEKKPAKKAPNLHGFEDDELDAGAE